MTPTQYRQVLTERNLQIADRLDEIAAERGSSPAQVALAWVLAQQARATVVPIVRARRRDQIDDALWALEVDSPPTSWTASMPPAVSRRSRSN
jgi:aryl-alcohol dehydrogenase-like predicted oxidoreductase